MGFSFGSTAPATPAGERLFRAVILDYGKVLCHAPSGDKLQRISELCGYTSDDFLEAFELHRPLYDEGKLTPTEFWRRMARETCTCLTPEKIEQLRRWDIDMWSSFDHEMLAWAKSLHDAGYKTAILSNLHLEFAAHFKQHFHWSSYFDVRVFSSELQLAKPDPEIFDYCIRQLEIAPQQALFVDDRQENIAAAKKAGIVGVQFTSVENLRSDLAQYGFQPLPGVREEALL